MDRKENKDDKTTVFGEERCLSEDKQVHDKGHPIQHGMVSSSPSISLNSTDIPSPLVSTATSTTDRQNKHLETSIRSEKMEKIMDERMKYNVKLNVREKGSPSMNDEAVNVGFGSNNVECGTQENEDCTRLDSDTVRQFNEKYTTINVSKVLEDQDMQRDAPVEQCTAEIVGKTLKSACATVEYSENIREKAENDQICTKGLGHCTGNESSTRTTEVFDQLHCNTDANSSLVNPLKDSDEAAPTSSHSNPCSGFSETVTSKPMFLGPLVSRDGSLYYIPVQSPSVNTSPNSPVFHAGSNLYAYVVAPNAGNPISTASIPTFPENYSMFNLPLYTNCAQLAAALTTNMISAKSLQRACSYMMAPTGFNSDSIASIPAIPSNQPATATSSVILLESLQQALPGMMASNGNNPNSIESIPVNQSSSLSSCCTTAIMSLEEAEKYPALQENQDSKASVDNNTQDRVPVSSEISHQSSNLDITSATIPVSNHEVNAHSELFTVQNTNVDVVRMSVELSQLFTKEDISSQTQLESSHDKTQYHNASIALRDTSEDQEGGSSGCSHCDIDPDTISQTQQESCRSSENTLEPCEPKCDQEGRKEKKIDALLQPTPPVQYAYSQLSKNDSIPSPSRPPLLSQDKHSKHKTSTLIRVSPRYSATKGRCSPLVRVSKNVSPLKPIRGHTQHYVITHGHDKRWTTGRAVGGEAGGTGNVRQPIYLRGKPPQGYRRRLLKTAAKTTTRINKRERKKRSSMEAVLEDGMSEQTIENNIIDEGQESGVSVKGFKDKIPRERSALSDQDTQNPKTPSRTCMPNDSRTVMEEQTPKESCTQDDQETHSKTPRKTYLSKDARNIVGDQAPKESCTQNDQSTHSKTPTPTPVVHMKSIAVQTEFCIPTSECNQKAPNDRASPRTPSKFTDQNITIHADRTPETSAQTPNNEKELHDFLTPEDKVFKTPRNEDRERKREREHRNCLELRDSFQQLCRLLPGTRSSWSRVKLLNLAVVYIQQMQKTLQDFERKSLAGSGELSEEEDLTANLYVVENLDEQDLVENPIYVLYPTFTSNTDEVGVLEPFMPTDEAIVNPMYNVIPMSVDEQCMDDDQNECTAVESQNLYSNRERNIAVSNIERYRFYENQIRIVPGIRCLSERRNPPEEREEPEEIAISEAEERVVSERNDAPVEQTQLKLSGVKAQSAIEVEVVAEGSAFGSTEEERQYLFHSLSSSPRGLLGQVSPNVLYTTSPSLAEIISSPVILIPGEHAQSTTEPKKDTNDQEPPRSPQYGAYGYSNATKNLNPFVVPQSPESLSVILGGTSDQMQIEEFSQSSNSQDSQNTSYGPILEDALNYVGASVSPFSTPRLEFLPSFTELSPSQVIPDHISNEDPDDNPVGVPDVVTDFSNAGLITVAASVEVPAGSIAKMPQRKPRKKKVTQPTQRGDRATNSSNKSRKNYKKVKRCSPRRKIEGNSMQDCTDYLDSSPKQTRSILSDYNTLKTPSPRIRGKKGKRTNDGEISEAIDSESDTVPLCPLPKKRGRKPKKSQNAECKRQLIDVSDGDLSNVLPEVPNLREPSDGPTKRGRKRKCSNWKNK